MNKTKCMNPNCDWEDDFSTATLVCPECGGKLNHIYDCKSIPEDSFGQPVHIYTSEEILDMPNYSLWFYGLVRDETSGEIILSEIYPGIGYSNFEIYEDDGDCKPVDPREQFSDIGSDIMLRNPKQLAEEYPEAERVDWESEAKEAIELAGEKEYHSLLYDFVDDRSLFLKFMDARYVLDFFLDNPAYAYYPDEIEGCQENPDLDKNIEMLEKYGIIEQTTIGCYRLVSYSRRNELLKALVLVDDILAEEGGKR